MIYPACSEPLTFSNISALSTGLINYRQFCHPDRMSSAINPYKPLSNKSYLFKRSPAWKQQTSSHPPSLSLKSWLNETDSLTKRLRGIYGTDLKVRILFHQWQSAFVDECQLLRISRSRYELIREVLLYAGETPLILARTILPEPTIKIAQRNLSHLGTRPLGEVIFAYPDLERRRREFSRTNSDDWSLSVNQEFNVIETVWGRRTLYAIHNQPLLVSEFFLPAILNKVSI